MPPAAPFHLLINPALCGTHLALLGAGSASLLSQRVLGDGRRVEEGTVVDRMTFTWSGSDRTKENGFKLKE